MLNDKIKKNIFKILLTIFFIFIFFRIIQTCFYQAEDKIFLKQETVMFSLKISDKLVSLMNQSWQKTKILLLSNKSVKIIKINKNDRGIVYKREILCDLKGFPQRLKIYKNNKLESEYFWLRNKNKGIWVSTKLNVNQL